MHSFWAAFGMPTPKIGIAGQRRTVLIRSGNKFLERNLPEPTIRRYLTLGRMFCKLAKNTIS
jgi:hypothetical protein